MRNRDSATQKHGWHFFDFCGGHFLDGEIQAFFGLVLHLFCQKDRLKAMFDLEVQGWEL